MNRALSTEAGRISSRPYTMFVVIGAVVAVLLLLGARAHDAAPGAAPVSGKAAQARSPSERDWNEGEDLKAAAFVGQPGIF